MPTLGQREDSAAREPLITDLDPPVLRVDDAEADGFLPIDASGYGPGHFSPVAPLLARSPAPKREAEKKGTVFGSVVNLCATAMGAGVLSLPHAFAQP